jgi:hypothetical protein
VEIIRNRKGLILVSGAYDSFGKQNGLEKRVFHILGQVRSGRLSSPQKIRSTAVALAVVVFCVLLFLAVNPYAVKAEGGLRKIGRVNRIAMKELAGTWRTRNTAVLVTGIRKNSL